MARILSSFLVVAVFLSLAAGCKPEGSGSAVCSPACEAGTSCVNGKCVDNSLIGPDAGTGSTPDGGGSATGGDAGTLLLGDGGCGGTSSKAQLMPLDIFIMLDQSVSMGQRQKWASVTSALRSFLQQPQTGVSVGLQYFGLPCGPQDVGPLCGSYGGVRDSCNPATYAQPDVEIAALPDVYDDIDQSIDDHSPSTATPTSAALQGAIDYATSWAQDHPGHVVIVILATDGEPTECDTNVSHIADIAAAAAGGTPRILTFVIGIDDGSGNIANLNAIAEGGGTDAVNGTCPPSPNPCNRNDCHCDPSGANYAFLVSTSGDVSEQFLAALNAIRGAALGCNYTFTTSGTPDYNLVNVQYKPGDGSDPQMFSRVADASQCTASSTSSWHYDNPTAPTQIVLCPAACDIVEADPSGEVNVVLGCQTIIN